MSNNRAYVEHVAIFVRDIHWHIRFFREVLGMEMREVDGTEAEPRQYWTIGGFQLIARPDFDGPEGRLAHFGVMVDDLEAAIAGALAWGAVELPQGRNWLQLPDGLQLELIQARQGAVSAVLAIDPRG